MTTCHDSYDGLGSRPPARRILVGVDGSPNSIAALRRAGLIANRDGARLEIVFAYTSRAPVSYPIGMFAAPLGLFVSEGSVADRRVALDRERADALRVLSQCIREAFGDCPPARVSLRPTLGSPRRVLADLSRDADLLVVGARGHSHALGFLVGSTAQACTRHAFCPVLVVPAEHVAQAAEPPSEPPSAGRRVVARV